MNDERCLSPIWRKSARKAPHQGKDGEKCVNGQQTRGISTVNLQVQYNSRNYSEVRYTGPSFYVVFYAGYYANDMLTARLDFDFDRSNICLSLVNLFDLSSSRVWRTMQRHEGHVNTVDLFRGAYHPLLPPSFH
jgi:hypothetical protein